jgi:putative membrane protein
MMWWPGGSWGWAGWLLMILPMRAFWAVIAWFVVALVRRSSGPPGTSPSAEEILAQRFARGEIDAEEHRKRLETLRSGR